MASYKTTADITVHKDGTTEVLYETTPGVFLELSEYKKFVKMEAEGEKRKKGKEKVKAFLKKVMEKAKAKKAKAKKAKEDEEDEKERLIEEFMIHHKIAEDKNETRGFRDNAREQRKIVETKLREKYGLEFEYGKFVPIKKERFNKSKVILTFMKHYKDDKDSYGVMGEMGDDSYRIGRLVRYTQESLPDINKREVEQEILDFTKNMKGFTIGVKSQYNFGKGEETAAAVGAGAGAAPAPALALAQERKKKSKISEFSKKVKEATLATVKKYGLIKGTKYEKKNPVSWDQGTKIYFEANLVKEENKNFTINKTFGGKKNEKYFIHFSGTTISLYPESSIEAFKRHREAENK